MDRDDPAYDGQRDYNAPLLRLYDAVVLGPIARFVWRCPSSALLPNYQRHIRSPHLDVGPGTGWFVNQSGLPARSHVTLVDPNPVVVAYAARQLTAFEVRSVEADVLKPLPVEVGFASAALNLVIHCLPGPSERKAMAVAHVAATLAPDGVLFGASVLGRSGDHTWLARRVLGAFNRRRAFDNLDDSLETLGAMLEASFEAVELSTVGSIAIFSASRPRR